MSNRNRTKFAPKRPHHGSGFGSTGTRTSPEDRKATNRRRNRVAKASRRINRGNR